MQTDIEEQIVAALQMVSMPKPETIPRLRLAGKDTITIADLADEHSCKIPARRPNGVTSPRNAARRRRSAPVFRTVEEKLEHVAAGHGIVLLPLSTAVFYTRPGIAYSHVSDIPPNQVCLAWDATRCRRASRTRRRGRGPPARRQPGRTVLRITLSAAGASADPAQAGGRPVPQAG